MSPGKPSSKENPEVLPETSPVKPGGQAAETQSMPSETMDERLSSEKSEESKSELEQLGDYIRSVRSGEKTEKKNRKEKSKQPKTEFVVRGESAEKPRGKSSETEAKETTSKETVDAKVEILRELNEQVEKEKSEKGLDAEKKYKNSLAERELIYNSLSKDLRPQINEGVKEKLREKHLKRWNLKDYSEVAFKKTRKEMIGNDWTQAQKIFFEGLSEQEKKDFGNRYGEHSPNEAFKNYVRERGREFVDALYDKYGVEATIMDSAFARAMSKGIRIDKFQAANKPHWWNQERLTVQNEKGQSVSLRGKALFQFADWLEQQSVELKNEAHRRVNATIQDGKFTGIKTAEDLQKELEKQVGVDRVKDLNLAKISKGALATKERTKEEIAQEVEKRKEFNEKIKTGIDNFRGIKQEATQNAIGKILEEKEQTEQSEKNRRELNERLKKDLDKKGVVIDEDQELFSKEVYQALKKSGYSLEDYEFAKSMALKGIDKIRIYKKMGGKFEVPVDEILRKISNAEQKLRKTKEGKTGPVTTAKEPGDTISDRLSPEETVKDVLPGEKPKDSNREKKELTLHLNVQEKSIANEDHPQVNEDAIFSNEEKGMFGIFDGMGGHAAGNVASSMARDYIGERLSELPKDISSKEMQEAFSKILREANEKVLASSHKNPEQRGMGTSASIVKVFREAGQEKAFIGNVGDSRVYVLHPNGALEQLTNDYYDSKFDSLDIAEKERLKSLQKKLGNFEDLNSLTGEEKAYFRLRYVIQQNLGAEKINPELKVINLVGGEKIVVTSDGIHDNLTTQEMERILREGIGTEQNYAVNLAQHAQERSRDKNHIRYKRDDMSAIVVEVLPTSAEKAKEPASTKNGKTGSEKIESTNANSPEAKKEEVKPAEVLRILKLDANASAQDILKALDEYTDPPTKNANSKEDNEIIDALAKLMEDYVGELPKDPTLHTLKKFKLKEQETINEIEHRELKFIENFFGLKKGDAKGEKPEELPKDFRELISNIEDKLSGLKKRIRDSELKGEEKTPLFKELNSIDAQFQKMIDQRRGGLETWEKTEMQIDKRLAGLQNRVTGILIKRYDQEQKKKKNKN